jgi:hypothetical protein
VAKKLIARRTLTELDIRSSKTITHNLHDPRDNVMNFRVLWLG